MSRGTSSLVKRREDYEKFRGLPSLRNTGLLARAYLISFYTNSARASAKEDYIHRHRDPQPA